MYIKIGKIVNTHGLKGEIKIISDIKEKELIFVKNNNLYIGNNYEKLTINTYRKHKNFDMVTFYNISDINEVLKYKQEDVYIEKSKIKQLLEIELIGMEVYSKDKYIGKVTEILKGIKYNFIVVVNNETRNLIPNIKEFVDIKNNKIYINEIEGLINEN